MTEREKVIITVSGGVPYVRSAPDNITVIIIDWDNLEGLLCPMCGNDEFEVDIEGYIVCDNGHRLTAYQANQAVELQAQIVFNH